MNKEYIRSKIEEIQKLGKDDNEMAHALEDDLYYEYVKYHADKGCELAIEIIKTKDLDFTRWYA